MAFRKHRLTVIGMTLLSAGMTPEAVSAASAPSGCNHTWIKGNYKTFRQVEREIVASRGNAKILRMALCGSGQQPFFQVTVLDYNGKVTVVQVPAHLAGDVGVNDETSRN